MEDVNVFLDSFCKKSVLERKSSLFSPSLKILLGSTTKEDIIKLIEGFAEDKSEEQELMVEEDCTLSLSEKDANKVIEEASSLQTVLSAFLKSDLLSGDRTLHEAIDQISNDDEANIKNLFQNINFVQLIDSKEKISNVTLL